MKKLCALAPQVELVITLAITWFSRVRFLKADFNFSFQSIPTKLVPNYYFVIFYVLKFQMIFFLFICSFFMLTFEWLRSWPLVEPSFFVAQLTLHNLVNISISQESLFGKYLCHHSDFRKVAIQRRPRVAKLTFLSHWIDNQMHQKERQASANGSSLQAHMNLVFCHSHSINDERFLSQLKPLPEIREKYIKTFQIDCRLSARKAYDLHTSSSCDGVPIEDLENNARNPSPNAVSALAHSLP